MKKTYQQLISEALEILNNDDEIFCDMVNELDAWNGYADGFRCYYMEDLDELFCDCKVSEFLDKIGRDFNHNDRFFVDTIYGLESTDSMADTYRDNVDTGELLDEIIDKKNHIYFNDSEFEDLIDSIVNYSEDDDEADEAETAGSLDTIRDRMIDGFDGIAAAVTNTEAAPEVVTA